MIGYNINSYLNPERVPIPGAYVLKPGVWFTVSSVLFNIQNQTRPSRIRTILYPVKDPSAPWLNSPLTDEEVLRIQNYAWIAPDRAQARLNTPIELSWGPLGYGVNDVDSHKDGLTKLLSGPRALRAPTTIDLWNELDWYSIEALNPSIDTVRGWIPPAIDMCRRAGIKTTVSVIMGADQTPIRPMWVYDILKGMNSLPDWMEIHCNGLSNEWLSENLVSQCNTLRARYGLPISIGEIDTELGPAGWKAICESGITECLLWRYGV